ncbi:mitochondrial carrier domain-containing protein, partial [Dimargaris cristalligena]
TLAAVASRLCTHPLDTIKTRIQADQGQVQPNWRTVVRHTLTTEPVRSLYRGLPVALGFSIPALTTYLTTYEAVKEGLHHHHSMGNYAVSAMCAEMLSGLIWTPMEVMKNRLQVIRRTGPLGPEIPLRGGSHTLALASQIYRTQGIAGFFRGYWLSIAVFVPHTVIYFVTYEKLKSWWAHRWSPSQSSWDNPSAAGGKGDSVLASAPALAPPLPFYGYLTCASMACVLSASISNIFDVVKTKWQVNQILGDRLMRYMWRHEGGYRAFSRGMLARVIWMTPSVTISMTTYEWLKHHM